MARRALTGEAKLEAGSTILAAVSGGPDSMTLLHVLAMLAPKLRFVVHAHGVDHGLRTEAARELDGAAVFAAHLGVPFARTLVHVARGGNLQARARTARYAALANAAHQVGARAVATAHHADDRAETVLLRLMRGAGPRGLAVLSARAPLELDVEPTQAVESSVREPLELVRPFVRARHAAILAHAERHAIPFATDPSNADPQFLRVRVRRELMPLLVELSPGIVGHLVALADQLAEQRSGEESVGAFPLPRSSQAAMAELVRTRSATARVWLAGGLVVTVDPTARSGGKQ